MSKESIYARIFQETSELHKDGSMLFNLQMNTYLELKNNMSFCLNLDSEQPYYYCQSGMPKYIYHGRLNISGKMYGEWYESIIAPELIRAIAQFSMIGNVYMISDDSKEIGVLFQPVKTGAPSPLVFAEHISQIIQSIYQKYFPHNMGRYCNTTALSDAVCGIEGVREGYLQTETLKAVSFFHMSSDVLTRERLEALKNHATYRDAMNLARSLCQAAAQGEDAQMISLGDRLFLDLLKHSYDMELVRDTLSYMKQFLSVRLSVHLPQDQTDLNVLCSVQSYVIIEECYEAILPVLMKLCFAVQQTGAWSDSVAHAACFLRSSISKNVSLPEIAAFADTTPAYLSNVFHKQTGMTIKQYQQKIRMEFACELLRDTDERISDIALRAGFFDRRYFTKIFKQVYRMTPAQYRESVRACKSEIEEEQSTEHS